MTPNIDLIERMKVISARINSGQDTYAGRFDAWHNLGTVFGKFSTWKEMLQAAGCDFEVIKKQLTYQGVPVEAWGTFRVDANPVKGMEDKAIKVRSSQTGIVKYLTFLAQVSGTYEVIQHTTGGFEMLDHLVGNINGAHYETMGTLDYGRVVWGQVDPTLNIKVGDDETKIFLTFLTSHDGSKGFEIYETGVRQVCRNTVRMGQLKRLANRLRVKHTKNAAQRIENFKAEIDEIQSVAMTMQERLRFLAGRKVTKISLEKIMDKLFPKKQTEDGEEESSTRRDNNIAQILTLYDYNDDNTFPEQKGTAYNLLNAVTEYTDHFRSTKNDMRAESAVFGSGDKLKSTAMSVLLEEALQMPVVEKSIQVDTIGLKPRFN